MSTPSARDFSPWTFAAEAPPEERERARAHLAALTGAHPGWRIGDDVFLSEHAGIDPEAFAIGDRSYVATGAYLTGTVSIGADCSINPYAVVRGDVRLGDAVRVGAHTSIIGFNHSFEPGTEVFRQPLTSRGVRIGSDVWIGSHVVVLDGVSVGDHAVLAAGAVVTKDVAPGAIVAGNPARMLRWRVPPAREADPLRTELARFADRARDELPAILDRAGTGAGTEGGFRDHPGATSSLRALCDAVELSAMLHDAPPRGDDRAGWIDLIAAHQRPATGLTTDAATLWDDPDAAYGVLSAGYALDLLGGRFAHPLADVVEADAAGLVARLDSLPWDTDPWRAGHHVDAIGTALHWSGRRRDAIPPGFAEALFGWLALRADPGTGMWGRPGVDGDLRLLVNGFYRAARGTVAQVGLDVSHPEAVVDTVLRHARDDRWMRPDRRDACTVLDIAHPLWLTRAMGYRRDEVRTLADDLLRHALTGWHARAGLSFRLDAAEPSMQGTEMWLAIVWYLADLLECSDALGYRPRGVHRPEPAPR